MNERERLELLMKCYDLSPSQFAEKTGIQRASVSHIISGRNKPSLEVMLKVYDAFPGIDMKWLMTGVGEVPVRQVAADAVSVTGADTLFSAADAVVEKQLVRPEGYLFAPTTEPVPQIIEESKPRRVSQSYSQREKVVSETRPKRPQSARLAQMMAQQPEKKIKEIRIYYNDGTYETLIPEK